MSSRDKLIEALSQLHNPHLAIAERAVATIWKLAHRRMNYENQVDADSAEDMVRHIVAAARAVIAEDARAALRSEG